VRQQRDAADLGQVVQGRARLAAGRPGAFTASAISSGSRTPALRQRVEVLKASASKSGSASNASYSPLTEPDGMACWRMP
jgi:hypothetical protein